MAVPRVQRQAFRIYGDPRTCVPPASLAASVGCLRSRAARAAPAVQGASGEWRRPSPRRVAQ